MYRHFIIIFFKIFVVAIPEFNADKTVCGCKTTRPCYLDMLTQLQDSNEEACIENAAIGASTIMIYLKAVQKFCPDLLTVNDKFVTYEGRHLYEVIINQKVKGKKDNSSKPIIIIEAGQNGGAEPVSLALVMIQQLIACDEFSDMSEKVKWVILPCTNPDGMEYGRFNLMEWTKNMRPSEDNLSFGVDISRNFDYQWDACEKSSNGFSPNFPGLKPGSEKESMFIMDVLERYKSKAKVYLSLRRNGHSLLSPYGYSKQETNNEQQLSKAANEITTKVNQRAGTVTLFVHDKIYNMNGKIHCGHSVDYAHFAGIPYTYEMRVFLGADNRIVSKFLTLPKGYEQSLLSGYLSGIRTLYNLVLDKANKNNS